MFPRGAGAAAPVEVKGVRWRLPTRHSVATTGVGKPAWRRYDRYKADPVRLVGSGASLQEGVEPTSPPPCQSFPEADPIAQQAVSYPTVSGCLCLQLVTQDSRFSILPNIHNGPNLASRMLGLRLPSLVQGMDRHSPTPSASDRLEQALHARTQQPREASVQQ